MKNSKKINKLSTAISFALILLMTTAFILPIASGQIVEKTPITITSRVFPTIVGVGQNVTISAVTFPLPHPLPAGFDPNYVTWTITRPNGTVTTLNVTLNNVADTIFDVTCDQVGTWTARAAFKGNAQYTSATGSAQTWTVQTAPTAVQGQVKTYTYVSAWPDNNIALGQTVYVVAWITPPREYQSACYQNLVITVTKPDGTSQTTTRNTNAEATTTIPVVVDKVGAWKFSSNFAGDRYHTSAQSTVLTINVLQTTTPVTYPSEPLPTGPWSFPISAEYRDWYQIAGSWPMESFDASRTNFNPYTKAPESAHVLWAETVERAGIVGDSGMDSLLQATPVTRGAPVAGYGRIFYKQYTGVGTNQHPIVICLDQLTGETLWKTTLPEVGAGGALALEFSAKPKIDPDLSVRAECQFTLWMTGGGGLWQIDPLTGNELGFYLPGRSGTYCDHAIYISGYNGTSNATQSGVVTKWDTVDKTTVWTAAISGITFISAADNTIFNGGQGTGQIPYGQTVSTWSITDGSPIVKDAIVDVYSTESAGRTTMAYGNWYFHSSTDGKVHAVSLKTGKEVWASEPNVWPWGGFGSYVASAGYGNYYQGTWDGYLSCYDGATGVTKWRTFLGNNSDVTMGHNVPWGCPSIAGGYIFQTTSEHTPPNPFPRGNRLYAIDAFTGVIKWSVPFMNGYSSATLQGQGVSAGMLFAFNMYDGKLYNFGKGESKTTVTAPMTTISLGTGIVIQGTITDQSPGAKDTPAVSDASQDIWMQYLYQNKPKPTNATGVPVRITAVDSTGKIIDVGHATTDIGGLYSTMWTPPASGLYTIVAAFEGSASYYPSQGETAIGVAAAVAPIVTPTPTAPTPTASPIVTPTIAPTPTPTTPAGPGGIPASTMYAIAAAVVVIVIVAVAAVALRRRK
jgi:outer membrane protein assembly factor BamB